MNKEREQEAEKYKNKKGSIPTTELEDCIFKQGFIDGATSTYVEKQKLEFAIEQMKTCTHATTRRQGIVLEELEQINLIK